MFFGFPCTYRPENNANRLLFISVLFGGMIFVIVVTTFVVKVYTSPIYNSQIETIAEILENNFVLVGGRFALQKLLQQNQVIRKYQTFLWKSK